MKTHTGKILIDKTRGLKFTESPRWHEGKLWFLDIHDKAIKTADLDGQVETAVELPFVPNAFGFRRDGSLLVGDAMQRQIHRCDGNSLQPLADLGGITTFCLSDGIVDGQDRMYVGDCGYNFFDPANKPVDTCAIACVEPDGSARIVADGLHFPNGIVITPDGKTLIVGETMGHRLTAFDVQADGSLANRRIYAQLPKDVSPDGIALDAEGAVWLANPEGRFRSLAGPRRRRDRRAGRDRHRGLCGDTGRAATSASVHLRLGLARSGRDRADPERDPAGGRGRGAGGGPSLR